MPAAFEFDWSVLDQYWGGYRGALGITLQLAAASLVVSMVLGLLVALMSVSRSKVFNGLAGAYIWTFRAVPIYAYLLWVYYGFSLLIHLNFTSFVAGVICLGTQYTAFQAVVFRAGIQAISKGQLEAAATVGLSRLQAFISVTMPQVLRLVLPPSGNTFIYIVKDTSLVAVIGLFEITGYTELAVNTTYRAFEFYTVLAGLYIGVVLVLTAGIRVMERWVVFPTP
jgi:His/Glu/Gln/Arg/opine family amino acid ABC transporter permease subunit